MHCHNCHCDSNKPYRSYSYAQYNIQSNPPSGSDLPMSVLFQEGSQISLLNSTEILLETGYLYLVDFIFSATPESDSFMQITPKINAALKLPYSFFAPAGSVWRNASASGSFTVPTVKDTAAVSFNLTYPETVRNIDITGVISVTALYEISSRQPH